MVTGMRSGALQAFAVDAKPADCAMLGLRGPLFQAGKQHMLDLTHRLLLSAACVRSPAALAMMSIHVLHHWSLTADCL